MYTDDEEKRGFPIRDFLLKLVLVIIFVLLLMWLLPTGSKKDVDLSPLTDRIFNANIQEMKEAAIPYFTTERLPKNVGDDVKLTLQQMLDLKLLLPFTDKNGDTCDTKNSYVLVTKEETEYLMKVYLKCNDDEDYILVHIGCYSYCNTDSGVCEKQETQTPTTPTKPATGPSCVLEITSGTKGSNNWYTSNVKVGFKSKKTSTSGAKIVDYGISTSSTAVYNDNSTITISKDGSTKVYGFVKDSNGKTAVCTIVVKKDTKAPECNLTVLSGTKNAKGHYVGTVKVGFASKKDATSGVTAYGLDTSSKANYNSKSTYSLSKVGTTKVYGYVKDSAGHTKVCSTSVTIDKAAQTSTPSCTLKVTAGTLGDNNWYRSDVVVGFATATSTNGAKITSYGIGTTENYNGSKTYTVSKDGTYVVKGYVKDSNGNTTTCSITIKRDATKPSCSLSVTSGTKASDGSYTSNIVLGFKSRTDATSGINAYGIGTTTTYAKNTSYTITTAGTHKINGYVKDNAGNTNVCSITVTKKSENYEYQYSKPIPETYSAWSSWNTKEYKCSAPPSFNNTNVYQAEDLGSKKVSYYTYGVGKEIIANQIKETGKVSQKTCKGYTYYKTSQTSTKTYAIHTATDWEFVGIVSLSGTPTDTLATKYVFVGIDWDRCGSSCTTTPYTTWKKYTRKVSTLTATDTITESTGATVKCTSYETKDTVLFTSYQKVVGYEETRTINYKTVCTYKYRTRTITKDAYTDYKWSYYNDQKLLNDGYKMTGNKRLTN